MDNSTTATENITAVKRSQSFFLCWGSTMEPVIVRAVGPESKFLKLPKSDLSSILKKQVFDRIQKNPTLQRRFICDERGIAPSAMRALKGLFFRIALTEVRQRRQVFPCNGKRPYTKNGVLGATIDKSQIWQWALKWPDANCGIAFNEDSPEVGVDVDAKNLPWLDRIQQEQGIIETRTVKTGRGGFHFYFLRPREIDLPNVSDLAHKGFELKSKHAYLMAAGCIHPDTGKVYELTRDIDPQMMPDWLVKLALESSQPAPGPSPTSPTPAGLTIPHGEHDAWLFRMARMYRGQGDSEGVIFSKLKLDLDRLADVDPTKPYTDKDLHRIARSAGKYSVNPRPQLPIVNSLPSPAASTDLKIPEIAWRGLFKDYRDMVANTTEASDAFHFATFLQIFGLTIARRLYVRHAGKRYPNFYTCNVGRSGLSRKDTAAAGAEPILVALHAVSEDDSNQPFKILTGLRSYEGLLDEIAGERKVRLIQLGELLSLLAKARQDSMGTLIPALTELYDCKDRINPPVHQREVKPAIKPFVSIMAGTTQAWLHDALTERDIYGGFANRWLYFYGLPKGANSDPDNLDESKQQAIIRELNQIRLWAENDSEVPKGEITKSKEAKALFKVYYEPYYNRCQYPGLIPTMIVRIQDFVWKTSLLYAAGDMSPTISGEHMEAAIGLGNYLEASVAEVFKTFGMTKERAKEDKLLEYLRSQHRLVPLRDISRYLTISTSEAEKILQPLTRSGQVRCVTPKGKRSPYYEALYKEGE